MIYPILIAIFMACFSVTLEFALRKGQIFGGYGDWLEFQDEWWTKPIGGCMVCTNLWANIILMVVYACIFDVTGWQWLTVIGAPFLSNAIFRLIDKNIS